MLKKIPIILIIIISISGCAKRNKFRIDGEIHNALGRYMTLKRIDVDIPVLIDSVRIKRDGSFRFNVKSSGPDFYQLGYSNTNFMTLLSEPGEKINVLFNSNNLYEDYKVTGSSGTDKIRILDSALSVTLTRIDSIKKVFRDSQEDPDFKEKEELINERFIKILNTQRRFTIGFILKNLRSFASIKALYQKIDESTYVLYDYRDLQFMKLVSDTLMHYYPRSKQVKALKADFEKELNQSMVDRLNQVTKDLPSSKLDPSLNDLNGKRITLSSLQGKYVLLAFWSADSRDCIAENLQLKDLYKKYNKKGFEIYQINLNTDEDLWKKAVRYDELPWISVREDDPSKPYNAIIYNVKTLPANYLYDPSGNIIANNLHGRSLQLKLIQLFGN
jgi:thiol-disulfide isomerase/thioredoxin